MDVPTIHVHSSSDKSTVGYVTFMWETMRSLANHPGSLKLTIHCMGQTAVDRLSHLPNTRAHQVPNISATEGLVGSMGHAACVEHALSMVDDGEIHVIVDSDTVVLAKGWDDYVRCQLLDEGIGTFGTTYEDIGGFSSGAGNVQTYKGIPNVVWMALSPLHRWRDLKARPKKGEDLHVANEGMSKVYGLPVGHHVLRDVAWQIPEYLAERGISYVGWKQLKPQKDATVLKGLSDYHEEYHLADGDVPFVAHHRGSMRHAYRGDLVSNGFYNAVDKHLEKERAEPTRWHWQPNDRNEAALATMRSTKDRWEAGGGWFDPVPTVAAVAASSLNPTTVEGWIKVVLDGRGVWGRGQLPVPSPLDVSFAPDATLRHIRAEGTVAGCCIKLPDAPERPYAVTLRNLTAGPITVRALLGSRLVVVPAQECMFLVVDVDGISKAS